MRLEQVFAPDTRLAMAQIQRQFGEDSMVVSNRRYNGRNELIAAVDSQPRKNLNLVATPDMPAEPPVALRSTEQQRGQTLVELIKAEFHASRLEMQNLTSLQQHSVATATHLLELQQLFMDTGMSARFSKQVLDQLASTKNLESGLSALIKLIGAQVNAYELMKDPAHAHLVAGHPGSGKSTMIARLATQLAAADESRKIAIISFNDDRIGAWQATQVAGARAGAETYRVLSCAQLQSLFAEIGETHHLLIDTAGANIESEIRSIAKIIPDLRTHLMLAADANEAVTLNLLAKPHLNWTSCMVSRLDGVDYPWAIISVLINSQIPVSLGSFCADLASPPRTLSGRLIAHLVEGKIQHQMKINKTSAVNVEEIMKTRSVILNTTQNSLSFG